jgi:flagellar biosynthesis/type III secretory pathway protein FliH
MVRFRSVTLVAALLLMAPAAALAQAPWNAPRSQGAYDNAFNEGYTRGVRAGADDARRGDDYRFTDESDYRRGDAGYRSQYGSRDRYRDEFRRGFEQGYRNGYGDRGTIRGVPPYAGNSRPGGRYVATDPAISNGYNDGYEAGLKDAQDRRRFDPTSEGRYRSGDHNYERRYGSKDAYKIRYRDAFRQGYEEGYQDASRYSTRGRGWF